MDRAEQAEEKYLKQTPEKSLWNCPFQLWQEPEKLWAAIPSLLLTSVLQPSSSNTTHNTGKTLVWKSLRLKAARGVWELPGPVMNWFWIELNLEHLKNKGGWKVHKILDEGDISQLEPGHAHNSL